jgi:hypothetical protein
MRGGRRSIAVLGAAAAAAQRPGSAQDAAPPPLRIIVPCEAGDPTDLRVGADPAEPAQPAGFAASPPAEIAKGSRVVDDSGQRAG